MNIRDMILNAKDLPVTSVEVPEWSCTCYVKSMTGAERLRLEKDLAQDNKKDGPALARVVCASLCDEQGNLLFAYPQEIDLLQTKGIKGLQRVFEASLKANALGKEDVENLQKN